MLTLRDGIVELYKKAATSIPKDIEEALRTALSAETRDDSKAHLGDIIARITGARTSATPVCVDSGYPVFFVKVPKGISHLHIREVIEEATRVATKKIPLRPIAVDPITGANTGDNVGRQFPLVYTEETDTHSLVIDLMLRGGDCEAQGRTYALPCASESAFGGCAVAEPRASCDLDDVAGYVREALSEAEGKICPPYILGVGLGGARDYVAFLSKKQLLRRLPDISTDEVLARFEARLMADINQTHTSTTGRVSPLVLGIKTAAAHRHPGSFFVDVSFACWAHRRARLIW